MLKIFSTMYRIVIQEKPVLQSQALIANFAWVKESVIPRHIIRNNFPTTQQQVYILFIFISTRIGKLVYLMNAFKIARVARYVTICKI